jgi:hypothetical protein
MVFQLSEQNEIPPEPYKCFYGGCQEQMPLLLSGKDKEGKVIDVPRTQASIADIIERRMGALTVAVDNWRGYRFFTGDGAVSNQEGDYLIVLEDLLPPELQFLRNCYLKNVPASKSYGGGIVLPDGAWDELKAQKDKVVHFTAEEVGEAFGNGYVQKDGVWVPANKSVGKIWDALSRGKDLTSYLQIVGEKCTGEDLSNGSDRILPVNFPLQTQYLPSIIPNFQSMDQDQRQKIAQLTTGMEPSINAIAPLTKEGKSLMRYWVIEEIYCLSTANCWSYTLGSVGSVFTVGLVPKAREKALEARVLSALEQGREFEFNGKLYRQVDSSSGISSEK